jgi:hypothetical protein
MINSAAVRDGVLYRLRSDSGYCDLRFGRMCWLRQDRRSCPFARST